ncbi:MAG: hypothetical protein KA368_05260 [Acidobacteria bacterium]|nr:hypothetical protein [Acidobacteriota bacterium]
MNHRWLSQIGGTAIAIKARSDLASLADLEDKKSSLWGTTDSKADVRKKLN